MVTQVSIYFAYGGVPLHTVVIWHKETLDIIQNGCYTRRVDTGQEVDVANESEHE
jgi:hypothetical protein